MYFYNLDNNVSGIKRCLKDIELYTVKVFLSKSGTYIDLVYIANQQYIKKKLKACCKSLLYAFSRVCCYSQPDERIYFDFLIRINGN